MSHPSHALSPGSLSRLSHSDYYEPEDEDGYEDEQLVLADLPRVAQDSIDREMQDEEEEEEEEEEEDEMEDEEEDDEVQVIEDDQAQDESSEDEIAAKPQAEQDSIRYEIQQMYDTLPNLAEQYRLVDRLGEGEPD